MSFFENLKSFIILLQDSNYDLLTVYSQQPNGVYTLILIVLALIFIIYYISNKKIKESNLLNIVTKVSNEDDIKKLKTNLKTIANELPKYGSISINVLKTNKNDLIIKFLALTKKLSIKEKISNYEEFSEILKNLSNSIKKYNLKDFELFLNEKSNSLLNEDLLIEIEKYYKTTRFTKENIEDINSIITYAKKLENSNEILIPLKNEISKFSFAFNLELYKFSKSLNKEESVDIYEFCNSKIDELFTNSNAVISTTILKYLLKNNQKEEVFNYIRNLENKVYLKVLYNEFFSKGEDINLDLCFIANSTKIDVDYKSHIDNQLTNNWKDLAFIKHIIDSKGVLEAIGHIDYRNVLERVEKLQTQDENNQAIALALQTARRAESIAIEAKTLARSK